MDIFDVVLSKMVGNNNGVDRGHEIIVFDTNDSSSDGEIRGDMRCYY